MKFREGASWPGSDRSRRPFWLHQLAEYLIGGMLVASGLQSPSPVVPAAIGSAIVLNAAFVKGPLSAFAVVGRRIHRLIDPVLIVVALLAAIVPWFDIDGGTRSVLAGIAVVYGFVWWYSSFEPAAPRSAGGQRGDAGRSAGRVAAKGVNAWRSRKR
ncbi:MAG: hypothetical protein WKF45_11620 [Ilumatobacteraceae bacterium]